MISVIVPAYNATKYLPRCLAAVFASTHRPLECIVVDDSSTDDPESACAPFPATVVHAPGGPRGPAFARNRGAEAARGDILFFVDADVVIAPDALARVAHDFTEHPEVAAVFGSYDQTPGAPNFVSQYKNLFHHYVHQESSPEAATFWSGCGAVRRAIFRQVGGFDAARYPKASIEDIEFGRRLKAAGQRILLDKELQGKHLKRWTLSGLVKCDVLNRAVPWTKLIFEDRSVPNDLNLRRSQRVSSVLLCLWLLICAVCTLFAPIVAALPLCGLMTLLLTTSLTAEQSGRLAFEPFDRGAQVLFVASVLLLDLLTGLLRQPLLLAPHFTVLLGLLLLLPLAARQGIVTDALHRAIVGAPAICAGALLFLLPPWVVLVLTAPLVGIILLNLRFYLFFLRLRGAFFALAVIPLHLLYYLYSIAGLLLGIAASHIERRKAAGVQPAGKVAPG